VCCAAAEWSEDEEESSSADEFNSDDDDVPLAQRGRAKAAAAKKPPAAKRPSKKSKVLLLPWKGSSHSYPVPAWACVSFYRRLSQRSCQVIARVFIARVNWLNHLLRWLALEVNALTMLCAGCGFCGWGLG
jgi:hypothetical protein